MKFPELKIDSNTPRLRFNSGRQFASRWAKKEIEGQRWFFFFISPLREHENHPVPAPGGCTVEPFAEDKLVVVNEQGEVVDFVVHDPDNPSADPTLTPYKEATSHQEPSAAKRPRLEATPFSKSLVSSSSSTLAPPPPPPLPPAEAIATFSYEDSLLNHEQPSSAAPAPASGPVISPPFRAIQPRPTLPPPLPFASAPQGLQLNTPVKIVRLRMEPRKIPTVGQAPGVLSLPLVNNANAQLKLELTQFQKQTNSRLSAVESRLGSMEARLAGLESVVVDISAQLRSLHALLDAAHNPTPGPSPSAVQPPPSHPAPAMPPELAFECAADDVVPLEPFSPASLSDEEQK